MTNIIPLPSFDNVSVTVETLPAGTYTLEIKEVRQQTIKSGKYEGQPVLNVGLATVENVWVWKQLPMFTIDKEDTKGMTWFRMSTVAFAKAINSTTGIDVDAIIGTLVTAEIGVQPRADRPDEEQNFIKTFIAE